MREGRELEREGLVGWLYFIGKRSQLEPDAPNKGRERRKGDRKRRNRDREREGRGIEREGRCINSWRELKKGFLKMHPIQ